MNSFRISKALTLTLQSAVVLSLGLVLSGCTSNSISYHHSKNQPGSSVSQPRQKQGSIPTPSASAKLKPVTKHALLNAKVPSLCGHQPGKLVNGFLPLPKGEQGEVEIRNRPEDPGIVIGDFNGDGVNDGVVRITCNAGGVPWPDVLLFYVDGDRLADVLDPETPSKSRMELTGQVARSIYQNMRKDGRFVRLNWQERAANDAACCPSISATGKIVFTNNKMRLVESTLTHIAKPDTLAQAEGLRLKPDQRLTGTIKVFSEKELLDYQSQYADSASVALARQHMSGSNQWFAVLILDRPQTVSGVYAGSQNDQLSEEQVRLVTLGGGPDSPGQASLQRDFFERLEQKTAGKRITVTAPMYYTSYSIGSPPFPFESAGLTNYTIYLEDF